MLVELVYNRVYHLQATSMIIIIIYILLRRITKTLIISMYIVHDGSLYYRDNQPTSYISAIN